jgi:hypothetical protein
MARRNTKRKTRDAPSDQRRPRSLRTQATTDTRPDAPPPGPIGRWLARHRNPVNFWLHMLGVPACFVAAPIVLVFGQAILAGVLFVSGYAVQFIGHLVEGNQSGEEALLRKMMDKS